MNIYVHTLVSLSLRLKDLLGPVTRVKKKKKKKKKIYIPADAQLGGEGLVLVAVDRGHLDHPVQVLCHLPISYANTYNL